MEQIKMYWNDLEQLKQTYSLLVNTYEEGAIFLISDLEKLVYKIASQKFDYPDIRAGIPNKAGGITEQVLEKKQIIESYIDQQIYGVHGKMVAGPLWSDDDSDILGAWILFLPKVHKMIGTFDIFAPIMIEMLPGGGAMYVTDREKMIKVQSSKDFVYKDLIKPGAPVGEVIIECLRQKSHVSRELNKETYGASGLVSAYPLIDYETQEVVGAFTLLVSREIQVTLKEMSNKLERGLSEISAAMEEMAAAANEMNTSQETLRDEIEKVKKNANEISMVLVFIKEIADETKMLGLNAAIEAARAGEAGRGFGVVAEEIRKLSDQSKQTVIQIKELLKKADLSIANTRKLSDSTLSNTQQVAATTEEVTASLEEMSSLSEQLDNTAAQL